MTTPAIYEELVVLRGASAARAIETVTRAVLGAILDPVAAASPIGPPDWPALEEAAAARAAADGADPGRLSPKWRSAAPGPSDRDR